MTRWDDKEKNFTQEANREESIFFFISFGLVQGKELYILFFQLMKLLM